MNRLYEGMFLLDANETAKRWSELETQIHGMVERIDGKIEYAERWPAQKLAYEVKGCRKGTYYLTYFNAPTAKIDELRRGVELSEDILRLLVIQEEWLEEEMQRRREAAASRPEPRAETPAAPAEATEAKAADSKEEGAPQAETATPAAEAAPSAEASEASAPEAVSGAEEAEAKPEE